MFWLFTLVFLFVPVALQFVLLLSSFVAMFVFFGKCFNLFCKISCIANDLTLIECRECVFVCKCKCDYFD